MWGKAFTGVAFAMVLLLGVAAGGSVRAQDRPLSTSHCSAPKAQPRAVEWSTATFVEMQRYQKEVQQYAQSLMDFRECLRSELNADLEAALADLPVKNREVFRTGLKAYFDLADAAGDRVLDVTQKFNASIAQYKARCPAK